MMDKFKFFRLKSPSIYFEICEKDLDDETIKQKELHMQDCKNDKAKHINLNGVFAEVIARITAPAEPLISAGSSSENTGLERSLNEIRQLVSSKWKSIYKDTLDHIPTTDIKKQKHPDSHIENTEKTTENENKKEYLYYKFGKDASLAEAILIKNTPAFLQLKNGKSVLSRSIELDNPILVPPDRIQYLSKECVFSGLEEIEQYIKRAENENLDTLFEKAKSVWKKYFDIDDEALTLCAADTIFTYFQDRLGMTHYLLFVGDNNTGKSNALRVFNQMGYRLLFDTSITTANIYNFLGQFEEGQG